MTAGGKKKVGVRKLDWKGKKRSAGEKSEQEKAGAISEGGHEVTSSVGKRSTCRRSPRKEGVWARANTRLSSRTKRRERKKATASKKKIQGKGGSGATRLRRKALAMGDGLPRERNNQRALSPASCSKGKGGVVRNGCKVPPRSRALMVGFASCQAQKKGEEGGGALEANRGEKTTEVRRKSFCRTECKAGSSRGRHEEKRKKAIPNGRGIEEGEKKKRIQPKNGTSLNQKLSAKKV